MCPTGAIPAVWCVISSGQLFMQSAADAPLGNLVPSCNRWIPTSLHGVSYALVAAHADTCRSLAGESVARCVRWTPTSLHGLLFAPLVTAYADAGRDSSLGNQIARCVRRVSLLLHDLISAARGCPCQHRHR